MLTIEHSAWVLHHTNSFSACSASAPAVMRGHTAKAPYMLKWIAWAAEQVEQATQNSDKTWWNIFTAKCCTWLKLLLHMPWGKRRRKKKKGCFRSAFFSCMSKCNTIISFVTCSSLLFTNYKWSRQLKTCFVFPLQWCQFYPVLASFSQKDSIRQMWHLGHFDEIIC